jgi:hypothetical protein
LTNWDDKHKQQHCENYGDKKTLHRDTSRVRLNKLKRDWFWNFAFIARQVFFTKYEKCVTDPGYSQDLDGVVDFGQQRHKNCGPYSGTHWTRPQLFQPCCSENRIENLAVKQK